MPTFIARKAINPMLSIGTSAQVLRPLRSRLLKSGRAWPANSSRRAEGRGSASSRSVDPCYPGLFCRRQMAFHLATIIKRHLVHPASTVAAIVFQYRAANCAITKLLRLGKILHAVFDVGLWVEQVR